MKEISKKILIVCAIALAAGLPGFAAAKQKVAASPFKYVGGTEQLPDECRGTLEVTDDALVFKCPAGSAAVPYSSITLMQYRPEVSRQVSNMKINWQVKPPSAMPLLGHKKNRFFVIVYEQQGATRGLVLEVPPATMRPFLAEIDVKTGKRVEVKKYEEYN